MLEIDFPSWPSYEPDEVESVSRVLRSGRVNYWTGDLCRDFEQRFAEWVGVTHAVALSNGTVALEIALRALGVGPGDEVITTPRSFFASASCIVAVGARPVFADVDVDSQNLTADSIRAAVTSRTKAVICVHLAGMPCEMDDIMHLADELGLKVVEDCAQAHGATYKGRSVGSIGHIGAWSFCQDKIITTGGEGGMVTTNDDELWHAMWSYKDHGKSWEGVYERHHPPGPRLVHDSFGTNARMIEVQAAIGLLQLQKVKAWTALREANARFLSQACEPFEIVRVPRVPEYMQHAWYRFYAFVEREFLADGWTRDRLVAEISSAGVPCFHGSASEIYLERAFIGSDSRPSYGLANAKKLGETALCFLVHPTLRPEHMEFAQATIAEVFHRATRN